MLCCVCICQRFVLVANQNGYNQLDLFAACGFTGCGNVEHCIIAKGILGCAVPLNGGDLNGGYGNVNQNRSYNIVACIGARKDYVCVNGRAAQIVCREGNGGSGERNSFACNDFSGIKRCSGKRNCNVYILIVCRIANNRCGAVFFPRELDGCDRCRKNHLLLNAANLVGNGDAACLTCVFAIEGSRDDFSICVIDHNGDLADIDCGLTVVDLCPATGCRIKGDARIGADGNRLGYGSGVNGEYHSANHKREHCHKSYKSNDVALACKLCLLIFHNHINLSIKKIRAETVHGCAFRARAFYFYTLLYHAKMVLSTRFAKKNLFFASFLRKNA